MIDAEYHAWLERVRPLSVYVVAVVVALVLARSVPAYADALVVTASIVAAAVAAVRAIGAATTVMLGTGGPRGALAAAVVAALGAAALAFGAAELGHGRFPTWSLFQVPAPVPRSIGFALVVPNAIAAALVFQAWLQTRIALVTGRWPAAVATVAIYALADRSPVGLLIAIAPAVARAESGSLAACIGAYVLLGLVGTLLR